MVVDGHYLGIVHVEGTYLVVVDTCLVVVGTSPVAGDTCLVVLDIVRIQILAAVASYVSPYQYNTVALAANPCDH